MVHQAVRIRSAHAAEDGGPHALANRAVRDAWQASRRVGGWTTKPREGVFKSAPRVKRRLLRGRGVPSARSRNGVSPARFHANGEGPRSGTRFWVAVEEFQRAASGGEQALKATNPRGKQRKPPCRGTRQPRCAAQATRRSPRGKGTRLPAGERMEASTQWKSVRSCVLGEILRSSRYRRDSLRMTTVVAGQGAPRAFSPPPRSWGRTGPGSRRSRGSPCRRGA